MEREYQSMRVLCNLARGDSKVCQIWWGNNEKFNSLMMIARNEQSDRNCNVECGLVAYHWKHGCLWSKSLQQEFQLVRWLKSIKIPVPKSRDFNVSNCCHNSREAVDKHTEEDLNSKLYAATQLGSERLFLIWLLRDTRGRWRGNGLWNWEVSLSRICWIIFSPLRVCQDK